MINRTKVKTLFLTGLLCLALFRLVFSQEEVVPVQAMTPGQLTADVSQRWNNIQDFQSALTVGVQVSGKTKKIEGAVWQKERVFRTEMTVPPEIFEAVTGYKVPGLFKALMVFDGKTMWLSLPTLNMVTSADISALEGKTNNAPFSKPFYSLPALSYKLSEKNRNGNDYYFLETSEIKDFFQKSAVSFVDMFLPTKPPLRSIGVWVNKNTLFPDLIEFYAQKNAPVMYMEFKNVKTDQGLSPKLFAFQVPKDALVVPFEVIKAMFGKIEKQSTAPDTTTRAATAPDTGQALK